MVWIDLVALITTRPRRGKGKSPVLRCTEKGCFFLEVQGVPVAQTDLSVKLISIASLRRIESQFRS